MNILEARLAEARAKEATRQIQRQGIAIVRDAPLGMISAGGPVVGEKLKLNLDGLGAKLAIANAEGIEKEPRETVLAMMKAKQLDENYTFKVAPGEADNYIQAMRQVLSRTRKKAKQRKLQLEDFKLLRVTVEETPECDIVTLVRTQTLDAHQQSVYDELMNAFAVKKEG